MDKTQTFSCFSSLEFERKLTEIVKGETVSRINQNKNVVILGCGPVGLESSIEFANLGYTVTAIDCRASEKRERAVNIWPDDIKYLESLGFPRHEMGCFTDHNRNNYDSDALPRSFCLKDICVFLRWKAECLGVLFLWNHTATPSKPDLINGCIHVTDILSGIIKSIKVDIYVDASGSPKSSSIFLGNNCVLNPAEIMKDVIDEKTSSEELVWELYDHDYHRWKETNAMFLDYPQYFQEFVDEVQKK